MSVQQWPIKPHDLAILRELAKRQLEAAHDPVMAERRRLWTLHNDLRGETPMVLIESGGVAAELPGLQVQCEEEWTKGLEFGFRLGLYHYEHVRDDSVVDPFLSVNWSVRTSGYGVEVPFERGTDSHGRNLGFHWTHPLTDLERDFDRLTPRTYSVDREATLAWQNHLQEVFDGILPVHVRGSYWWTLGMTGQAINLIGLENLMLYMYDQPEALHRLMAFLRDDHLAYARWLESEGLLSLNNGNDYTGSGSRGFTTALPQTDWREGDRVRLQDLWVLSESQETVSVSPAMFAEFIFPYQQELAEQFGLCYYGCCEPVNNRWDSLRKLKNLRSVSISPWCDEAFMAEALGSNYVYSRKPAPASISTGVFDEDRLREDIRTTLRTARGCNVEVVMKDVHTLNGEPERLGRWVALTRQVIAEESQ